MRFVYVLLSPTFGMHQYTADLANRALAGAFTEGEVPEVHVVTSSNYPEAPYNPLLSIHTPLSSRTTGFSREGSALVTMQRTIQSIMSLAATRGATNSPSDVATVVHITGAHLWNVELVRRLVRRGIPVVHTLHDLQSHSGVKYGSLIPRWNSLVIRAGAHILVHGQRYKEQLLANGLPSDRATCAPLLHGFWRFGGEPARRESAALYASELDSAAHRCKYNSALFFGRVEAYKGVETLLAAWSQLDDDCSGARLVVAGAWPPGASPPSDQPKVEFRNHLISDHEAIELFCEAALLVLPYRDATQSALIAAAYSFGLPVIVTDSGALPEYVLVGKTGWVIPPGDPDALTSALREALGDRVRLRRMGANGRAWYEEQRILETQTLAGMYEHVTDQLTAKSAKSANGN